MNNLGLVNEIIVVVMVVLLFVVIIEVVGFD